MSETTEHQATEPSATETQTDTQPAIDPAAPGAETTTPPDEAKPADPAKPTPDARDRAIRQLAFEQRELRRQNQALRDEQARANPRDPNAPPSQADLEQAVEQRAQALVEQRAQAEATQTWVAAGNAAYPEFTGMCNELASMGAAENPAFMAAIGRVQDGHKVIAELAADPAETSRILKLPAVDLAIAVASMAHKIAAAPPPPPRQTTQAPPPIRPLATAARAEVNLSNLDGAAFRSAFLKQFHGSR